MIMMMMMVMMMMVVMVVIPITSSNTADTAAVSAAAALLSNQTLGLHLKQEFFLYFRWKFSQFSGPFSQLLYSGRLEYWTFDKKLLSHSLEVLLIPKGHKTPHYSTVRD